MERCRSLHHAARCEGRWCNGSSWRGTPPTHGSSPSDRRRHGPATRGHPIQDAARKARLNVPAATTTGSKAIANDGLVAEEGVLDARLPVVARRLLPLAPPERFHVGDRAIARPRAWHQVLGLENPLQPLTPLPVDWSIRGRTRESCRDALGKRCNVSEPAAPPTDPLP